MTGGRSRDEEDLGSFCRAAANVIPFAWNPADGTSSPFLYPSYAPLPQSAGLKRGGGRVKFSQQLGPPPLSATVRLGRCRPCVSSALEVWPLPSPVHAKKVLQLQARTEGGHSMIERIDVDAGPRDG